RDHPRGQRRRGHHRPALRDRIPGTRLGPTPRRLLRPRRRRERGALARGRVPLPGLVPRVGERVLARAQARRAPGPLRRPAHHLACGVEAAGFELRDTLMWLFGQGFPKSRNLTGAWQGWGTALKPAYEPILLARKPLAGTTQDNADAYSTGAINVDGCRDGN